MKKIILALSFIAIVNNSLPYTYSTTANAGIFKWAAGKIIKTSVSIIFSNAKESIVEYNKRKLVKYLNKHPEHIDSTVNYIKKYISKHPKFNDKGLKLVDYIANNIQSKLDKNYD